MYKSTIFWKTRTYKIKTIQKEFVENESFKYSTQHPIVNEFSVINIPEEDVKTKQKILDPDDQPMWESAKTVAPTPNSAIVQPDVDDNFVINSTHLKMILENKFDGILRAGPHDHIREFLAICDMLKYGDAQNEWEKSQNIFSEQTDRTKPPLSPSARTEQVNAVFIESGKSDDPSKIQKDPPPPIIVKNKIEKDRPIKTLKKDYYVVKSKEYPISEYIPKIPYP
nr:hypothetical protein [Tanacetum cinerariifolium]